MRENQARETIRVPSPTRAMLRHAFADPSRARRIESPCTLPIGFPVISSFGRGPMSRSTS